MLQHACKKPFHKKHKSRRYKNLQHYMIIGKFDINCFTFVFYCDKVMSVIDGF